MSSAVTIILTGSLLAAACALLGCFLILRKMAMLTDAISHAILPGIVAGYFIANGPNLLLGFLGASVAGLLTVLLVEALRNTRRVGGDSAIGIVFPAMFALGTVLVSRFFADVHLDTDAILYGNIEFANFDILTINGYDLGPQSLWVMSALCIINLAFIACFYKELKLATFDAGLAASLGFSPALIHYALMTVVSVTTVGGFTAVGAILVVALVIVPAAAAYLLTDRLPTMIALSVGIGVAAAISGYVLASLLDASIAGAMATMTGMFFGVTLLFSPLHGLIPRTRRTRAQRKQFAAEMLIVHLSNHEGQANAETESAVEHLGKELRWSDEFAGSTIELASREGLIVRQNGHVALTDEGRTAAQQVMTR